MADTREARGYQAVHPHLRFRVDLGRPGLYRIWCLLGEIISQCKHVAGVPLDPNLAQELHEVFMAKGAQATTAIEGNTLTEDQVRRAVRDELSVPESQQYLAQEVENIIAACNWIENQEKRLGDPTPKLIKRLHAFVLDDIEVEDHVLVGEFRKVEVGVGGKSSPGQVYCPELVGELCRWLAEIKERAPEGMEPTLAVIRAVLAHLYLVWIHPFGDGNGRTARLLEFWILKQAGFPSISNHLLSNHYNTTRTKYYRVLESSKGQEQPDQFLHYALEGFADQLREQIQQIRRELIRVSWENYVYSVFQEERGSPATDRRRRIAIDLPLDGTFVSRQQIRRLNLEVTENYAGKTNKTLSRDINALLDKELVVQRAGDGAIRADVDRILAFMPKHELGG